MLNCRFEDLIAGHHDTEINHFVTVTAQYHANDVFPDVVYIALDGSNDDLALGSRSGSGLFFFDERHQVGNGLLHDAGGLNHLWQEHFAGTE